MWEKTRAVLPEEVEASGYGERVVAIVSVLSGMYRHSHRMVVTAMSDLFGVRLSLGTVNRLRKEASESVFVARMLTVVTSLRSQERNVLEFMTKAIRASRQGSSPPSLVPQESYSTESMPLAA